MKKQNQSRTLSYIGILAWALICAFMVCLFLNSSDAFAASKDAIITKGKTNVYFRDAPGGNPIQDNGSNIMLNGGHKLKVIDTSNKTWYKVTLAYNGTTYTGYVCSDYITMTDGENNGDSGNTPTAPSDNPSSDTDFENYLSSQGFPESYKPQLRSLHELHPNWVFRAVNTGLDWETVVDNEINKSGQIKNLVEGTSSNPHYNWRSTKVGYSYKTDKWSSYDGSHWFAASDELVSYYLDPRVYLYERFVFAFEQLSYDESQSISGVESILSGTFMSQTKPSGYSSTYGEIIMKAAKKAGISPYHIASRIKQEVGSTSSYVTNGSHPNYPGIYNFYNIGGFDSSSGNAVSNALYWASTGSSYGRPWTTVYKSIYGGAQYIGNNYILKNQNTLYTEKFNVTNTSNLYNHQYMSNVQAVSSEASKVFDAYSNAGTLNSTIIFSIPYFKNMPDEMVSKPADTGSPNNYLKSLSIKGYSLTPTFDINKTTEYSLIVPENVSSVSISAAPVNSGSSISGTGTISLSSGTNTVKINVTAPNGSKRTYTLTIVRGKSSGNSGSEGEFEGSYTISDEIITGVSLSTTVDAFIANLGCSNGTVVIYNSENDKKTSGNIGTGDKVKIKVSGNTTTYHVVIYGDLTGDGKITALDLLKLQKHLIGSSTLQGAYLKAANIKREGKPNALDLLKIQKYLMGAAQINQN